MHFKNKAIANHEEILNFIAYKIQTHQPLTEAHYEDKLTFAKLFLPNIRNKKTNMGIIFLIDEAAFWLSGYITARTIIYVAPKICNLQCRCLFTLQNLVFGV